MVLDRVALTGASGMLGRHLLSVLADEKVAFAAASRREPRELSGPESSGLWGSWDLGEWRSPRELDRLFGGATALIHAGATLPSPADAESSRGLFDVNVRACLCLGEWALGRGIPLVFISSSTVYADPEKPGLREGDAKTAGAGLGGFYAASKLLAEQLLGALAARGLALCVLRPSSVYGAGLDDSKLVARFLSAARDARTLRVSPPGDDAVNLLHARDLARAALAALRGGARGTFNVAGAAATSLRELAAACVETTGKGAVAILPAPSPARAPKVRFDLDCGAARAAFGYRPEIALKDGLCRMAAGRL